MWVFICFWQLPELQSQYLQFTIQHLSSTPAATTCLTLVHALAQQKTYPSCSSFLYGLLLTGCLSGSSSRLETALDLSCNLLLLLFLCGFSGLPILYLATTLFVGFWVGCSKSSFLGGYSSAQQNFLQMHRK